MELKKLVSAGGFTHRATGIDNAPACASGGCGASCMTK
jgi:hypothetical protein